MYPLLLHINHTLKEMTKIEWTNQTWNPITGCTKISEGCRNCYAEGAARRLKAMNQHKYDNGFKLTLHPECLDEPEKWKSPCMIFVCSMSDLFHKDVPFAFIDRVFDTIRVTPHHTYQVLTKRPERMQEYFETRKVPHNVWIGVTVENKAAVSRIEILSQIRAETRFLSCEPLLDDLGQIPLDDIDWLIVGGESGNQARPMKEEWAVNLREQARENGIPFFFKQWGTWGADGIKRTKSKNGCLLQSEKIQQWPEII